MLQIAVVGNRYVSPETIDAGHGILKLLRSDILPKRKTFEPPATFVSTFQTPFEQYVAKHVGSQLRTCAVLTIDSHSTQSAKIVRRYHPAPRKLGVKAFNDLRLVATVLLKSDLAILAGDEQGRGRAQFARLVCESQFVPYIEAHTEEGLKRVAALAHKIELEEQMRIRTAEFRQEQLLQKHKALSQWVRERFKVLFPEEDELRGKLLAVGFAQQHMSTLKRYMGDKPTKLVKSPTTLSYILRFENNAEYQVDHAWLTSMYRRHKNSNVEFNEYYYLT